MRWPTYSLQRLSFLLTIVHISSTDSNNSSSLRSVRTPRVSGRIVKLYTHPKHEGFKCTSEGFHEDPDNCAIFYRCVAASSGRFATFRFQCGPNTVFDPETGICNFPTSTRRIQCGGNEQLPPPSTEGSKENEIDSDEPDLPPPSPISTKNPLESHRLELTSTRVEPPFVTVRTTRETTIAPWLSTQLTPSTAQYVTSRAKSTEVPVIHSSIKDQEKHGDQCFSDGFMGDSRNCRKFYRCVANGRGGFIRYEFLCSESTVWDDNIQACNHAWAARSSRCGRSEITDNDKIKNERNATTDRNSSKLQITTQNPIQNIFGDRVKVNQLDIQLQTSQRHEVQPVTMSQSQKLTTTHQTQLIKQSSKTTLPFIYQQKTTKASQGYYGSNDVPQNDEDDTVSTQASSTTSTERNKNNECTTSGFIGDSKDCKKFYRCVDNGKGGFTKYEFTCGEGTVWDSNTEACNHAWAVKKCGEKEKEDTNKEEQTTKKETTASQSTTTSKPPKTTSRPTTEEISDTDDDDSGYNRPTQQQQIQTTSTTEKTTTTEKVKPSTNKDNMCTSSGFMGDSDDCKKFYRCVDNGRGSYIKYEFSCGEGTVWDANIEACNHAWAVKECGGKKEDVNKVEETTSSTSSKPTQTSSQFTTDDIDDSDQGYNRPTQTQQVSETTTTERTKPSNNKNNECTSSGFMGDTEDCKKFYRCVDNAKGGFIRYEFSCGEGTVWDSNAEACNHEWAVKQCGGKSKDEDNKIEQTTQSEHTPVSTSQPTSESHLDDEEPGYGQPVHEEEITTSTTVKDDTSNKGDQCTSSGFIGDSKDCKKFYRCVDNGQGGFIRYEFSCGEGTVWDQSNEACNHAWAVKECGGKPASENDKIDQTTQSSTHTQQTTTDYEGNDSGYRPSTQSSTTIQVLESNSSKTECSKEGFMGDSKDCKKFYRCVDNGRGGYIKYEFSCGEGTIWDSDLDACNHKNSVKRPCSGGESQSSDENTTTEKVTTETSGTTQQTKTEKPDSESTTKRETKPSKTCKEEGFIGDENDCKKFYRCVDNGKGGYTKYEFSCGDGTVWDQDIQACNHESMTKNCGGMTSKPSSSTEKQIDNGYGQEPEHDEEVTESTKPTDQPSKTTTDSVMSPTSDDKCTAEGFYPDSNDCKKFYRCVDNGRGGYTKYDFTCGEGTVWDQEVQACNHPTDNKNCKAGASPSKPASGTTQSSQEESTTSRQEETTSKQEQTASQSSKPSQSDGKCESEGFYADQNDCKKFYRCVDNGKGGYTKYDFACGEGTVWDQEIQGCNFQSNVNCKRGSPSSTAQQSETTQSTQQQTTERVEDEYVTPESDKEEDKPNIETGGKCKSEGFYANENNCKKFYRCVDNGHGGYTRYDFDCGEGTAWDQDAQTCNHENTVNCQSSSQNGQNERPPDKEDDEQPGGTDKPSSDSSTQESTTQKQQSSEGKCEQEGYFGNPNNCKKFYRCVDNGKGGYTKYDFDCGEGTIWDQDLTTCNHPGDVQNPSCKGGNESESSTTSSSQQSSSSTTESSQSEQSSSSSESESSSSKPTKVSCPEAGFYANPDDCKKFYRCVDFEGDGKSYTVFHFDCGEDTIWDPNLDTCNYEDSIYPPRDCSKQSQNQEVDNNEDSESTTSTTTQKSTTEEQTTTEATTTTQQSTTEEQTTTQQSTTEKSTTQEETATEEQTTTEKTTTSSSTTTTTTTEPTTKQEETTTQKSTTTTTEGSTTTEESTTTTTEGTTTTTEESTTTTEGTTTTTTEDSTTTTTEDSTTTTTEDSTTKESTTEESTTQESTTQESTTHSTTEGATTESQSESQTEGTTEEQESQTDGTTEESTTESSTEDSGTTESSSSDKDCPETDDDQYLLVCPTGFKRHPKYCNLFYQCTEDSNNHDIKVATFHCENNTIYDEGKNQCVEEKDADQKCDGEIAERRRFKRLNDNSRPPISTANTRLKCPAEGHFPFDQKDDCSPAFLKCQRSKATQKLRAFVYRCPEGFTYWAVSRRCEHTSKMNECRTRDNLWKGRWEIPVETSNVAPWR